jgi:hypothetical protein
MQPGLFKEIAGPLLYPVEWQCLVDIPAAFNAEDRSASTALTPPGTIPLLALCAMAALRGSFHGEESVKVILTFWKPLIDVIVLRLWSKYDSYGLYF